MYSEKSYVSKTTPPPATCVLDYTGQVARLACGAVANAAEDSSTHPALLSRTNAMHYMVFLMRSRHLSVHREASRACGNLLTTGNAHKDFISEVLFLPVVLLDETIGPGGHK